MKSTYSQDSFGEVTLKGFHWHDPSANPQALLVIVHGMMETIERYDAFASYLVENRVFVYGHSHRGHGETAGSVEALGDMGENGWVKAREDVGHLLNRVRRDYPGVPVILFGHSMGSFLVRDLMKNMFKGPRGKLLRSRRRSETGKILPPQGIILSGTGYYKPWLLRIGGWIAGVEMKWKNPLHRSNLLFQLSFGGYNKRIEKPETFFDWLSSDRDQVRKYVEDPYCGQVHTSRFFREFYRNLLRILHENREGDPPEATDFPLFLIAGEEDPVGEYGEGVIKTKNYYRQWGCQVSMKLYPGARHELLNEINRQAVYQDIVNWILEIC